MPEAKLPGHLLHLSSATVIPVDLGDPWVDTSMPLYKLSAALFSF